MHVAKTGTIKELIDALIQKAQISGEEEGGKIRVYETSSNRFYREPSREHPVANLNDFTQIYAERVPQEELTAPEDSRFVQVFHFQTDVSRVHGVPFKFLLVEVSLLSLAESQLLTFNRERSLETRRSDWRSEVESRARALRRSSLRLSDDPTILNHNISTMVSNPERHVDMG